jgi:diguanylate cyclase (GGDEF)-like protein
MHSKKVLKKAYTATFLLIAMSALGWIVYKYFAESIHYVNLFRLAAISVLLVMAYIAYRWYFNKFKPTAAKAERAEWDRAQQAERRVQELKNQVEQLEKSANMLRESHARFRHAAYHDGLTGLPNRNYFIDTVRKLMQQKFSQPLVSYAVLFLDMNGFRKINDSFGHSVGDQLVKQVAGRLLQIQRTNSVVGRFGGDEFAIVLMGEADERGACEFAETVARTISQPFILDGKQVFASVSIGIALGNLNYDEPEEILRDADIAMYYAKDHGEEFVVFNEKMHTRAVSLVELETDLRFAIERGEFEMHYQPIVDLQNLQLAGFEALVRWNHPTFGQIAPDRFIPVSESTGLIVPMTLTILEMSCAQMVDWQKRFPASSARFVSVNISGVHFGHPALVEQIKDVLARTGINPRCLKLEITETAIMENGENAVAMLREIKDLGVQLSIDDFGTGYSSLGYLQQFPIDTLKIDRVFIRSMEDGRQNGEIVRAVLALANSMNLEVVAEGIESIHQYHQLRILSCHYGQGFLFSRPVSKDDAESLLADPGRWRGMLAGGDFVIVNPDYEPSDYQVH